ncbi:MAG TPA: lysylphosphatidylglycerol synthase domain-containing protein [Acidimicrobiia bacterium]|nr:lysylphosphatidylglycerol synthase domain-containing protein [Acidimicrobiia bacterium]
MQDTAAAVGPPRLLDRWRRRTFGADPEQVHRRRASDCVRVAIAALLLVAAAHHAGTTTDTERALFDVFNSLPNGLLPLFRSIYRVGALWTVGLVVVSALVGRRWRLARDLLIAGVLAWGFGRIMGEIVVEGASLVHSLRVITRTGITAEFPAVRLAIVVAVTSAARPYVTRPVRRIGHVLVIGVAMAALYLGSAFPNDVFAGLVLGWGIGAAVHLAFGSPGGTPSLVQVKRTLAELGVDAHDLSRSEQQRAGATLVDACDDAGPIRVKVIGRDEADAQFLSKLYRFVVYKESGPRLFLTRLGQVEHEAYVTLLAREAGVRVPRVVVAGKGGPGAAVIVQRVVDGLPLAAVEPGTLDDATLATIWAELAALHDAHVVHGRLDADHVVLARDGPTLVGFGGATTGGGALSGAAADVAELLVTTSVAAGEERAVAAAIAAVPRARVEQALAFLQAAALTRRTRVLAGPGRRALHDRLERLRALGARALGTDAPEVTELRRITPASLGMAVGTLVAAGVLLGEIGDPSEVWDAFRHAEWQWIAVALALSFASNLGYAIALQGTVPVRLPLWRTTELQVGMSFTNLAIPGVGGLAMQIRYLQRQGVDLGSAVAAGGLLSTVGNLAVALGLFAVSAAITPAHVDLGLLPASGLAELLVVTASVVAVVAGAIVAIPRLRRAALPPVQRAAATLWNALRSPRLLALLLGGNVVAALFSGYCMLACLLAFGGRASFWAVLAAYIGVVTIAAIVPIPGGGTAVSSVGMSGALVALGVPEQVAIASVLVNQIVYNYLPAVPGWFATRDLARHDYL